MNRRLAVAVVGAGYWGPNVARNFHAGDDWDLAAICDLDVSRGARLAHALGGARFTADLEDLLRDPGIDAIAVATPAQTHHPIVLAALDAGKHVMVEKPLATTHDLGAEMVDKTRQRGLVLMTDHTYCFTPAVMKIQEMIAAGLLGEILFVDTVRINLGLIQPDVNVFWDLAPHDLSILDFILPDGLDVSTVAAHGADPLGTGKTCVGYLTIPLSGGAMAHVHVNWLSPTKIRQMVIGGTRRTVVWDDLNPQQRLSVYDRGVDLESQSRGTADKRASTVSYRLGDTWSPALPEQEALANVVAEFAGAIRDGRQARTDGPAGLRVLSVLQAADRSLAAGGAPMPVGAAMPVGVGA